MLVFIEEALSGLAEDAIIGFSPEVDMNEYFQTSQILMTFETTYPNAKIILDSLYNAPFRNRVVALNAYYQEPGDILGPQFLAEDPQDGDEQAEEAPVYKYLKVEMTVDCFTIPGEVKGKNYDFMIGPYNNTNPFEVPEVIDPTE